MKELVFATNNAHKLDEVRAILGPEYHILSLADIGCHDDIPETGSTLEENAWQKTLHVAALTDLTVFADDTGLEVSALGGAPGVYTARYGAMDPLHPAADHETGSNIRRLLRELDGKDDRTARFRTVIALLRRPDSAEPEHVTLEGSVEGEITAAPTGTDGFGYDPVFRPEGCEGTFAEMGPEAKNRISHRCRAVEAMKDYLDNH